MIVKIPIARLAPGMHVVNPGLSPDGNPHLYLDEGEIGDASEIERLAVDYFDTYIDTEKGGYFSENKKEKREFESAFGILFASDEGDGRNACVGLDDVLKNYKKSDQLYSELLGQYKEISQRMLLNQDADMASCESLAKSISETSDELLTALLLVSRMRLFDPYTYTHSLNVSMLSVMAGRSLGFSADVQTVFGLAGLLHDVGKVMIPEKILKKPGKLTATEYAEVKRHPVYGRDLLMRKKDVPAEVLTVAHEHHEHYDGTGYPRGIAGTEINKTAAMVGVIDTYDALRSDRYYREAISAHRAICVVYSLKGKSFHPEMVNSLIKGIGIYPVGSMVVLRSGKKAVVTGQNPEDLLRPKIRVVLDSANRYCKRQDINLKDESGIGFDIVDTLTNKECRVHVQSLLK